MQKSKYLILGGGMAAGYAAKELDLNAPWESFDLHHELTRKGIQQFVADYESTLRKSA